MHWSIFALATAFLAFEVSAQPLAAPKLFKSYSFDAPIASFAKSANYYDCSADLGGTARCIDNVEFLGHSFAAALKFNEGRLSSVSLATDFDEDLYFRVAGVLGKTFGLCALQNSTERLDVIDLARKSKDQAAFQSKLSSFESLNLSNGNLTYIFVELPITELRGKKNAVEAILSAPPGTRVVELTVAVNDSEEALLVTFTLPKLALQKIKKAMDAPAERF